MKCNNCGNEKMIGVEYNYTHPERYDGISEWFCQDCGQRVGRWTGQILKDGECESRYGKQGVIKINE